MGFREASEAFEVEDRRAFREAVSTWPLVVHALRNSGVAEDLTLSSLGWRLRQAALTPPTPETVLRLLDSYFAREGHPLGGCRRRRQARYVMHRAHEAATPESFVARLGLACPELGLLSLAVNAKTGARWVRSSRGYQPLCDPPSERVEAALSAASPRCGDLPVPILVAAVNRLLLRHDLPERFLPLTEVPGKMAFVGVTVDRAAHLDLGNLLARPLAELVGFASWSYRPQEQQPPSVYHVA